MAELEQPLAAGGAGNAREPVEAPPPANDEAAGAEGFMLHGVVRTRGHEKALAKLAVSAGEELIEHRGLGALVHSVPYRLPDWDVDRLRHHNSAVERAMRRCTILPAPYGIVFRGREQVIGFLDNQHVALDEALSFVDAAYEVRLHVRPSGRTPGATESELEDMAAGFYTSLRRRARAAFTLPPRGERVLSAAFLVNRGDWVSFVELIDELEAEHPEFQFDQTHWPPYDFVRMAFFPAEKSDE
jgi:hypothetical protein